MGDIDRLLESGESILDYLLKHVRGEERVRLRDFIDDVLKANLSDNDLQDLWRSVNDEVYFPTAQDLRQMLRLTRDRLHEKRAPSRDPGRRPRGRR